MHDADLISLNKKDSGKVWDILSNVIGEGKSVCRNADFICNREAIYDDFAVSNEVFCRSETLRRTSTQSL